MGRGGPGSSAKRSSSHHRSDRSHPTSSRSQSEGQRSCGRWGSLGLIKPRLPAPIPDSEPVCRKVDLVPASYPRSRRGRWRIKDFGGGHFSGPCVVSTGRWNSPPPATGAPGGVAPLPLLPRLVAAPWQPDGQDCGANRSRPISPSQRSRTSAAEPETGALWDRHPAG